MTTNQLVLDPRLAALAERVSAEAASWPRKPRRKHADHHKAQQVLRARPGMWRLIAIYGAPSSADSIALDIRRGVHPAYQPAGAFEVQALPVDVYTGLFARCTVGVKGGTR
jgi:hypothetical protein